jgi:hypothetical protein
MSRSTVLTRELPTEPDPLGTSDGAPSISSTRQFAIRHAAGLSTLAVLAVILASAAWFTRTFYYFQDDFIFIRQAQTSGLSLAYLRDSLFQHFSPFSRLADYVLAHWFHSSVSMAHTMELILLAASVLSFSWAIAELVGPHWWRHLLTLGFGESLALLHLLGWWTAAANILPATMFGLLTIAGFLRYRGLGNRKWAVVSLLSYGLSLVTHEQSWLVPGYLILFEVFVFAPDGRFRNGFKQVWRDKWIWIGYVILTIAAMINYFAFYYASLRPKPTLGELVHYVGIQLTQSIAPSAVGLRPLASGWLNALALLFDSFLFLAIVIVSIYRCPRAWRVWTVFAIGFLANATMIGANRVGYYGVDYGKELYYIQAPAYLFLLCVGAAFSLNSSGAPYVVRKAFHARPRGPGHVRRQHRYLLGYRREAFAVAIGLYGVAFATSATAMNAKDLSSQESAASRAYFTKLNAEIDMARSHGRQVVLDDTTVPSSIVLPAFAPFNQLSSTLAILRPYVRFGQPVDATFKVKGDGSLAPAHIVVEKG